MTEEHPYHHGDLRDAALDAASAIIERDSVDGLRMKAVADATDVATSAIYHHFENKAALLAAVGRRALEELRRQNAAVGQDLQAMGMVYLRYAIDHPSLFRLMFHPSIREGLVGVSVDSLGDLLHAQLRSAVAQVAAPTTDVDAGTILAWSWIHGLATLIIDGPLDESAGREPLLRAQLDILLRGITR